MTTEYKPITEEEIELLTRLENEATEGPWEKRGIKTANLSLYSGQYDTIHLDWIGPILISGHPCNIQFIIKFRNLMSRILEELKALRNNPIQISESHAKELAEAKQAIKIMAEALTSIEYNLEGDSSGYCQPCTYNLQNIRPEAKEALSHPTVRKFLSVEK